MGGAPASFGGGMSGGMARVFVSAAHKSSGKTTVSIGLCAALAARGLAVQPFKKGPDYIDPLWLSAAAGRACRNLDHNTMDAGEMTALFRRHAADADIAVIEGNKGLHDGVDLEGTDSSAALATLLRAPVVLVIDAGGITRGVAPLLLGLRGFAPGLRFAGVILQQGVRGAARGEVACCDRTIHRHAGAGCIAARRRHGDRGATSWPRAGERGARSVWADRPSWLRGAAGIDLDRLLEAARRFLPCAAASTRRHPPAPPAGGWA